MSYRDKPEDLAEAADEYELQPTRDTVDEPLLPRYEARPGSPTPATFVKRRRRGGRRPFLWLCVAFFTIIPLAAFGAGVCYYRRNEFESWDKFPAWLKEAVVKAWPTPGVKSDNVNFPSNVGYAGPTPTGSEAFLLATAPVAPLHTHVAPLVPPPAKTGGSKSDFIIAQHWGNLSPYYSVKSHGLKEEKSTELIPGHCELQSMHWLQRHGARYPTSRPTGPAGLAARLKSKAGWKATKSLEFLNGWKYKLGAELLTPFGRSQLFNLGAAARIKYGFLLDKMKGRKPVFRTESQDRMLRSAQNFATGFFGIPIEDQYNLEVMIEWPGFNCSLAPYHSCPNDLKVYPVVKAKLDEWDAVYLKHARKRVQKHMDGYDVTIEDVKDMQEMCAYETVALGYSAFCDLFTEKEWAGFQYRNDIYWWYGASFGSPVARAEGLGWLQELTARLTHTPITTFNSSINSTLHDKVHFPLNDPLYVDFTHDTTFAQLLPAMNLTTFSASGTPRLDKIPHDWSFVSSKFCPFATNLQVQVLECDSDLAAHKASDEEDHKESAGGLPDLASWWPFAGKGEGGGEGIDAEIEGRAARQKRHGDDDDDDDDEEEEGKPMESPASSPTGAMGTPPPKPASNKHSFVRVILNDAPVPLHTINGCGEDEDGLCSLDAFVSSMHTLIGETNFASDCLDDYIYDADSIVDGRRP